MQIFGDERSGNCLKVKWTADYLNLPYQWVETDVLKGQSRTDEFLSLSPGGQVPIIKLETGTVLSQSNAIVLFLLREAQSPLFPDYGEQMAKMMQWMFWEQYTHEPAIAVRRFQKLYLQKTDDDIDPILYTKGVAALSLMEDTLGKSEFLCGAKLTAADIALLAYTRFAHEGGFELNHYPHIQEWIARSEHLLGLPALN